MRKKFTVALMALFAACLLVLSGCGGPSVEELIREDLTTQFDEVKNGEEDFLEGLEEGAGDSFDQLGIDASAFAQAYLDGFDYSIDEIVVEDTTATATVTLKVKSMGDIVNEFNLQFADYISTVDLSTITEDDLYAAAGQMMLDITNAAELKDVTCNFTYSQDDEGEWSADESAETELTNALMG